MSRLKLDFRMIYQIRKLMIVANYVFYKIDFHLNMIFNPRIALIKQCFYSCLTVKCIGKELIWHKLTENYWFSHQDTLTPWIKSVLFHRSTKQTSHLSKTKFCINIRRYQRCDKHTQILIPFVGGFCHVICTLLLIINI